MSENEWMRKDIIDMILWIDSEKLSFIRQFVYAFYKHQEEVRK